jgi:pyridoxamine 5'-phosphate oxidase-like protein
MREPSSRRPHMPGYGVRPADEGSGLLPWSWAERQLRASHNFWVVTLWPDGRPHAMPVWGVWDDNAFWFTSAVRSRKALNIANDPRCTVATEDEQHPVVLNGGGDIHTSSEELARVIELINAKYGTDYGMDFMDPAKNATIRVQPQWAFGVDADDFTGSPTRWTFE